MVKWGQMYPNQPQPPVTPTPTPPQVDYLNSIAPQTPKKPLFVLGPKLVAIVAVALIVIVGGISLVINTATTNAKKPLETLSARLTSTEAIVTAAKPNIKSSALRTLNSNLAIYMTNTNRDAATPLKTAGIDTAKLSKSVLKAESPDAINARLEDARLNAVYDRTYAREMAYQLETLISLMKQIYSTTHSASLKAFLQTTFDNLAPTQKAFSDFNAANG